MLCSTQMDTLASDEMTFRKGQITACVHGWICRFPFVEPGFTFRKQPNQRERFEELPTARFSQPRSASRRTCSTLSTSLMQLPVQVPALRCSCGQTLVAIQLLAAQGDRILGSGCAKSIEKWDIRYVAPLKASSNHLDADVPWVAMRRPECYNAGV